MFTTSAPSPPMTSRRDPETVRAYAAELGLRIRRIREAAGYSQTRFGEVIGADRNSVGRWERGDGLPDALNVDAIARACRVPVDWLLRGQADEPAAAVLAAWRASPRGKSATDSAMLFLETLPLGPWAPTPLFYDLVLVAFEQGLSQAEAIDAARVTTGRTSGKR